MKRTGHGAAHGLSLQSGPWSGTGKDVVLAYRKQRKHFGVKMEAWGQGHPVTKLNRNDVMVPCRFPE